MKRTTTLLTALLAATSLVEARQLTPAESLERFSALQPTLLHKAGSTIAPTEMKLAYTSALTSGKSSASNAFYIFDLPSNAGFVVLAADDLAPEVLGYSESGRFQADNLPEGLQFWMGELNRQIGLAVRYGAPLYSSAAHKAQHSNISPLVSCKWGQGDQYSPFYDDCPTVNGTPTVAGCVATAMAQVMYKHQYPSRGQGSKSYTTATHRISQSANFNTTYNWTAMQDEYGYIYEDNSDSYHYTEYSQTSGAAVAKLMHHCGVAVDMDYNIAERGGSGTLSHYVMSALYKYFKYDAAGLFCQRDYHSDAEWEEIVYNELANDRPVFYSGATSTSGHAFVLDGYRNGYYHVNWGWDNMANGYYLITGTDPLHPASQGTGGSVVDEGFGYNQCCITGLQPARSGSKMTPNLFVDGGKYVIMDENQNETSQLGIDAYGILYVPESMIYSVSNDVANYYFGVKMVNVQTQEVTYQYFEDNYVENLPILGGLSGYYFHTQDVAPGNYRIYPVTRFSANDEWTDVHVPAQMEIPVVTIGDYAPVAKDAELACSTFSLDEGLCIGRTVAVRAENVLNTSSTANFFGKIAIGLYDEAGQLLAPLTEGSYNVQQQNALEPLHYYTDALSFSGNVAASQPDGHYLLSPIALQEGSANWARMGYFDTNRMEYNHQKHFTLDVWVDHGNVVFTAPTDEGDVQDNTLYIASAIDLNSSTVTLPICLSNDEKIAGFQFDMMLPEGVTFAKTNGKVRASMSTQRTTTKATDIFDSEVQADGSLRVVCASTAAKAFTGNDGEVANVVLNVAQKLREEGFTITLKNIVVATTDAKAIKTEKYESKVHNSAVVGIADAAAKADNSLGIYGLDGKRAGHSAHGIILRKKGSAPARKVITL